ncbi:hypothetical protein THRCLA_06777 [Thraustotheca clavata]|uniref:SH3 domain-containing protein n=1 Tax=Thraustotheca clavata TaxID=74557 RepID=A0A1V9ZJR2_9STRA|nr:hypothetical protein THRCLA_06777 [Thraustotheca clavata]
MLQRLWQLLFLMASVHADVLLYPTPFYQGTPFRVTTNESNIKDIPAQSIVITNSQEELVTFNLPNFQGQATTWDHTTSYINMTTYPIASYILQARSQHNISLATNSSLEDSSHPKWQIIGSTIKDSGHSTWAYILVRNSSISSGNPECFSTSGITCDAKGDPYQLLASTTWDNNTDTSTEVNSVQCGPASGFINNVQWVESNTSWCNSARQALNSPPLSSSWFCSPGTNGYVALLPENTSSATRCIRSQNQTAALGCTLFPTDSICSTVLQSFIGQVSSAWTVGCGDTKSCSTGQQYTPAPTSKSSETLSWQAGAVFGATGVLAILGLSYVFGPRRQTPSENLEATCKVRQFLMDSDGGLNEQLVALITELVRKEVDSLFQTRYAAIQQLHDQVKTVIKDVERITTELEGRKTWNRTITKYEVSPVKLESPTKKKQLSFQQLPSLLDLHPIEDADGTRNEDGKLVFAKKLPRVASIDKQRDPTQAQLKQKLYESTYVKYPECRSTVFAPSTFKNPNTLEPPAMQLQLDRAHGYHPTANSNTFYLASGEIVWNTAMLVVIYSKLKQTQRFYCGHSREVTALGLHPNQTIVGSGQCGKDEALILVWDAQRARQDPNHILATLRGQTIHIKSISFSHDGKLVASLGGDLYNTICIHEWHEETLLVKVRGHSAKVNMVAFNPYQAYGIPDKTKTLLAPAKNGKKPKWNIDLRAKPGQALRDDDACYTLVSCGVQHIKFWTLNQTEYIPPITAEKEDSAFYGSSFGGPNRMRQLTPHEKVWKMEGNAPLMKSDAQDFTSICFSNDTPPLQVYNEGSDVVRPSPTEKETSLGRIVAATAKGDLYVFWQPRKAPLYAAHLTDSKQAVVPMKWWELPVTSWHLDGDSSVLLQHIHFEPTAKLVEIIPHDVATGNKFKISRHAQTELADLYQRLALKPDAKAIRDRIQALEYKGTIAHTALCSNVSGGSKQWRVASVGYDNLVHIWTLHLVESMRVPGTHTLGEYTPLSSGTYSSDGRHRLQLELSLELPIKAKPTSLAIEGNKVLIGMQNHTIYECLLDSDSETDAEWTLIEEGSEGNILGGVVIDSMLVTLASDQSMRWWDLVSHECLGRVPLKSIGTCVDAAPFGSGIVVGCVSGELLVFDTQEMNEKKSAKVVPGDAVTALKFSPDGKYIAVGGKDNCFYLVDTSTYKRISKCEGITYMYAKLIVLGHATCVAHIDWSIDGYLLQTNASDGEILYWQVNNASLRQITDTIVMRDILWDRWSCVYGWPVQGIWGDDSSTCSDILSLCPVDIVPAKNSSADVHHLVVGFRSTLRSFRWPCLRSSPYHVYEGHSGSITTVLKWSTPNSNRILTLGGADSTILEWKAFSMNVELQGTSATVPEEQDEIENYEAVDNTFENSSSFPSPIRPPRNSVEDKPRTPRTPRIKEEKDDTIRESSLTSSPDNPVEATIECRRAKYDFVGENDDELSFKAGEVICIVEKRIGDWWYGETCDGTRGIFPHEYLNENESLEEVLSS